MTIARTPSEARLASLHLDFSDLNLKARPAPLSSNTHQSRLTDDDLEGLEFPSLGTSVIEEQETHFAMLATKALSFLATPEADRDVYSPYTNRSPLPDCDADANPYFTTRRNLYHDGADSWTPRSFSSSSSSSATDSGYSSPASSCDAAEPCSPTPALSHKNSSLAARRGKPLNIVLPPTPNVLAEQQRTARSSTGFALPMSQAAGGVLKNNFAGVSLRGEVLQDEIEGPLSPALRRRPRAHGFAF